MSEKKLNEYVVGNGDGSAPIYESMGMGLVQTADRDVEIANLEFRVVEAAVKYRGIFKWADSVPLSEYVKRSAEASDIKLRFNRAVDALIAAREEQ